MQRTTELSDISRPAAINYLNSTATDAQLNHYARGMERLIDIIQHLSLARHLNTIIEIVRHAARELSGADGATFVLRDNGYCHYVDEDAISPLWKGKRFPEEICISGWAMRHRQPVVIEDISLDARIPYDVYEPTFVKSLLLVPIRSTAPIGAIGCYWANRHPIEALDVKLLHSLADATSVAIENVQLYSELEQRIKDRTVQLEITNKELESFSYSVSHDLRAPVRNIEYLCQMLIEDSGLSGAPLRLVEDINTCGQQMSNLIEDLLSLAKVTRTELQRHTIDLSAMTQSIASSLSALEPQRNIKWCIQPNLLIEADTHLVHIMLTHLLSNAFKYTRRCVYARIEIGTDEHNGRRSYFVRDNGAGFNMEYGKRLFQVFQRLHTAREFEGTGVGLATAARIIQRHGGEIWAESAVNQGATFFFTLQ